MIALVVGGAFLAGFMFAVMWHETIAKKLIINRQTRHFQNIETILAEAKAEMRKVVGSRRTMFNKTRGGR